MLRFWSEDRPIDFDIIRIRGSGNVFRDRCNHDVIRDDEAVRVDLERISTAKRASFDELSPGAVGQPR